MTRDKIFLILVVGTLAVWMAYQKGLDGSLDARDADFMAKKVKMADAHFMKYCGNVALIKKRSLVGDGFMVMLREDDYLQCLNDRLTKH